MTPEATAGGAMETPRRLGPYELVQLLGAGAMGEVYLARDTRHHDRRVAVKLLPQSLGSDPEFMTRFEREARTTAQLSEPHVIPVHSYGAMEGRPYIEMRLVQGSDLHQLLQRTGPLPAERALSLITQAAAALDAAHAEGLVHRDVKPSNLLVTPQDFLYVVDFGIARPLGTGHTVLTSTGVAIGTLQYMAPERFLGGRVDGRVDVYSLACVLVECLTGEPPFRGDELPALLYAHVNLPAPRVSEVVPGVPAELDDVVARGMSKDPADRFETAGALAAAATEALAARRRSHAPVTVPAAVAATGGPPGASAPPLPATAPADVGGDDLPQRRRRIAAVTAGVLVLLAVGTLAVLYGIFWRDGVAARDPGGSAASSSPATGSSTPATTGAAAPLPSSASPTQVGAVTTGLDNPHDIALSPDETRAYVADARAGQIQVVDLATRSVVDSIPIAAGPPQYVTLSADGRTAYVTTSRNNVADMYFLVVDVATHAVVSSEPVGAYPLKPAVSPDGGRVYVPLHDQHQVEIFDAASGDPIDSFVVPDNPHSIAITADGGEGYVADHESNVVTVWDLQTLEQIGGDIDAGQAPHRLAFSPDGSQLAVVNFRSSDVLLIDTADRAVQGGSIPVGSNPQDVAYAPDGRHLYTVNLDDGTISVVDVVTRDVQTVPVGKEPTSIVLRADGSQAFVTVSEPADGAAAGSGGSVVILATAG